MDNKTFKIGEAPWEKAQPSSVQSAPQAPSQQSSFPVGSAPWESASPQNPSLGSKLTGRINQLASGVSQTVKDLPDDVAALSDPVNQGNKMKIGTDLLHTAAAPLGAIKDIAGAGVGYLNDKLISKVPLAYGPDKKVYNVGDVENVAQKGVKKLWDTKAGQTVSKFAQDNPDVAQAFNDAGDVAAGAGVITAAGSGYQAIKSRLSSGNLVSDLTKAGVDDPEGVANTLSEHGITPGSATYKQGITTLRNALSNANNTLDELKTGAESAARDASPMSYFPSTPGFENPMPPYVVGMQNHVNDLQNALQALQENGQDIYGPAIKQSTGLLGGAHITPAKIATGILGANAAQKVGGFLYNKFVGPNPWTGK